MDRRIGGAGGKGTGDDLRVSDILVQFEEEEESRKQLRVRRGWHHSTPAHRRGQRPLCKRRGLQEFSPRSPARATKGQELFEANIAGTGQGKGAKKHKDKEAALFTLVDGEADIESLFRAP